jgi:hypothetical protein
MMPTTGLEWIGRRNLTREAHDLILGRRYNRTKKSVPNPSGSNQHGEVKGQNDPQPNTAAKLAVEHGVSEATVKRAGLTPTIGGSEIVRGSSPPLASKSAFIDSKPHRSVDVENDGRKIRSDLSTSPKAG